MVLRYAHVHGNHIDDAIRAIGRTLPKQPANEGGAPITPELHTPVRGGAFGRPPKGNFPC